MHRAIAEGGMRALVRDVVEESSQLAVAMLDGAQLAAARKRSRTYRTARSTRPFSLARRTAQTRNETRYAPESSTSGGWKRTALP